MNTSKIKSQVSKGCGLVAGLDHNNFQHWTARSGGLVLAGPVAESLDWSAGPPLSVTDWVSAAASLGQPIRDPKLELR